MGIIESTKVVCDWCGRDIPDDDEDIEVYTAGKYFKYFCSDDLVTDTCKTKWLEDQHSL